MVTSFVLAMLAGIFCVYAVMVLLFHDFGQPATVLAALPLASTGALGLLWLYGLPLSMPALIGLLMLIGRSEEHTSEVQSLMRLSSAVFCVKHKKTYAHQT